MIETPVTENSSLLKDSFIEFLENARDRDDRAALASLRRGLGAQAGALADTDRVVQPHLRMSDGYAREQACQLIGGLFALHPLAGGKPAENMGDHFRAMCEEPDKPTPNIERRFMSLLASDQNDLDATLRQAVMLLKAHEVPVNWQRLLWDVMAWKATKDDRRADVQRRWSRRFWRIREAQQEPTQP